jgi:hypothetical protein
MAAYQRLPPHSASRGEGRRKDQIHLPGRSPRGTGCIIRSPHLAQDLCLSQYLGIDARADQEEVTDRSDVPISEQPWYRDSTVPGQVLEPGFTVTRTGPVQLTTVARGEQEGGAAGSVKVFEDLSHLASAERKGLTRLDRRRMVTYANDMKGKVRWHAQR